MRKQPSLDLHRLKVNSNLTQTLLVKALDSPRLTPRYTGFSFSVYRFHPAPILVRLSDSQTFS